MTASGNGEEELIKEAERTFARTRRLELGMVVVATIAAMAALGVSLWLSHLVVDCTNPGGGCYNKTRDANIQFRKELRDLISDVGQCQTLQLLEHRDANEKAHSLNAEKHGYAYAASEGEAPPPIPEELKEACAQFIPKSKGGTR